MTQNTKKSLLVIQTTIAVIASMMFAAGLFGIRATGKLEAQQRKSSVRNFDEKLRPFIGKPYTEERHYKLLELMQIHDDVNTSSIESLTGASQVMRNAGGIAVLGALASIFLLLKRAASA